MNEAPKPWYQRNPTKKQAIVLLFASMFMHGVIAGLLDVHVSPGYLIHDLVDNFVGVLIMVAGIGWYVADCEERGQKPEFKWEIGIFLLLIIIFPAYLFYAFGFKRGLIMTLKSAGLLILSVALSASMHTLMKTFPA